MPPLIAAVLLGAGAYAGFQAARHVWTRINAPEPSPVADAARETEMASVRDLGQLELDPVTGVYRPTRKG